MVQIPYKDNDILALVKKELHNTPEIYLTSKSRESITGWLELIDIKEVQFLLNNSKILYTGVVPEKHSLIISRQQLKFGHQKRTSEPEEDVQLLLKQNRIKLSEIVNGYKIYIVIH